MTIKKTSTLLIRHKFDKEKSIILNYAMVSFDKLEKCSQSWNQVPPAIYLNYITK